MALSKAKQAALPADRATYLIGEGFHIPQRDAGALGRAFEALEKKLQRAPSAVDIVEAAKSPKSPFNRYVYDVDAATAEYRYRLERAQYVIQALRVYLPQYEMVTRALQPDPASDGGFIRTEVAVTERRDVMDKWANRLITVAQNIDEEYGHVAAMRQAPQSIRDFVAAAHVVVTERPTATRTARAAS